MQNYIKNIEAPTGLEAFTKKMTQSLGVVGVPKMRPDFDVRTTNATVNWFVAATLGEGALAQFQLCWNPEERIKDSGDHADRSFIDATAALQALKLELETAGSGRCLFIAKMVDAFAHALRGVTEVYTKVPKTGTKIVDDQVSKTLSQFTMLGETVAQVSELCKVKAIDFERQGNIAIERFPVRPQFSEKQTVQVIDFLARATLKVGSFHYKSAEVPASIYVAPDGKKWIEVAETKVATYWCESESGELRVLSWENEELDLALGGTYVEPRRYTYHAAYDVVDGWSRCAIDLAKIYAYSPTDQIPQKVVLVCKGSWAVINEACDVQVPRRMSAGDFPPSFNSALGSRVDIVLRRDSSSQFVPNTFVLQNVTSLEWLEEECQFLSKLSDAEILEGFSALQQLMVSLNQTELLAIITSRLKGVVSRGDVACIRKNLDLFLRASAFLVAELEQIEGVSASELALILAEAQTGVNKGKIGSFAYNVVGEQLIIRLRKCSGKHTRTPWVTFHWGKGMRVDLESRNVGIQVRTRLHHTDLSSDYFGKYIEEYQIGSSTFASMQYYSGGTLRRRLPTLKNHLPICLRLAQGLKQVHENVGGDCLVNISPDQVVFDAEGKARWIGLEAVTQETNEVSLDMRRPFHPEVLRSGKASKQSDIWQLGWLFWQMYRGKAELPIAHMYEKLRIWLTYRPFREDKEYLWAPEKARNGLKIALNERSGVAMDLFEAVWFCYQLKDHPKNKVLANSFLLEYVNLSQEYKSRRIMKFQDDLQKAGIQCEVAPEEGNKVGEKIALEITEFMKNFEPGIAWRISGAALQKMDALIKRMLTTEMSIDQVIKELESE